MYVSVVEIDFVDVYIGVKFIRNLRLKEKLVSELGEDVVGVSSNKDSAIKKKKKKKSRPKWNTREQVSAIHCQLLH